MAVTRVSRTKDGRAAIRYAFEEKSHKDGMERVLASSGSNLDPKFAMMQMKAVWDSAGKNEGKSVQVYRIIQSFGLNELDPENPADIEKANLLGLELAKELYPDRQALIATQADGEGGKLHNHILINSVSAIDGKSLGGGKRNKTTHWKTVSDASDRVLERNGMKPLVPDDKRPKLSIAETKIREVGEYSWKNDLAGRIGDALYAPGVTDKDTFEKYMLDQHDVTVKYGKSNRVKYSFEDADGNGQDAGIKALGAPCGMENIQRAFERNERVAQEKLAQQRLDDAETERLAMVAQPETLEIDISEVKAFNLDDVLSSFRTKPKKKPVEMSKPVEIDDVPQDVEKSEDAAAAAADDAKIKADADALKAKQERELRDAAAERERIEAQRQAQMKANAEKALKRREESAGRLLKDEFLGRKSLYDVPEETLTRFIENEDKWMGKTFKNGITNKEQEFTTPEIYRRTKIQMADEKRAERQGVQNAVDQGAQADGPER